MYEIYVTIFSPISQHTHIYFHIEQPVQTLKSELKFLCISDWYYFGRDTCCVFYCTSYAVMDTPGYLSIFISRSLIIILVIGAVAPQSNVLRLLPVSTCVCSSWETRVPGSYEWIARSECRPVLQYSRPILRAIE